MRLSPIKVTCPCCEGKKQCPKEKGCANELSKRNHRCCLCHGEGVVQSKKSERYLWQHFGYLFA
jgi:hypothetical protein